LGDAIVEGIYGTRPWIVAGEGPSSVLIEGFREEAVNWTIEDFRFTTAGDQVFAFQLKWPEGGKTVIRSLASGNAPAVLDVKLLGAGGVKFEQNSRGLAIDLPEQKPCDYAQCLRITLAK
jgi:alpha-L-fucosidase